MGWKEKEGYEGEGKAGERDWLQKDGLGPPLKYSCPRHCWLAACPLVEFTTMAMNKQYIGVSYHRLEQKEFTLQDVRDAVWKLLCVGVGELGLHCYK